MTDLGSCDMLDPRLRLLGLAAVALALFDYLRKSRARGFVVSLSGGADSAACSVLVATALRLAQTELGWENTKARLSHLGKTITDEMEDVDA